MVEHQLPFFSLLVPFWLVALHSFARNEEVGRILVAGVAFAVEQFLISNFHVLGS